MPAIGPLGMAWAVSAATIAMALAASVELGISDGLAPFDRKVALALAISLAGIALMAVVADAFSGPARFVSVLLVWAVSSWGALRLGLTRNDRLALGALGRGLRLNSPPR